MAEALALHAWLVRDKLSCQLSNKGEEQLHPLPSGMWDTLVAAWRFPPAFEPEKACLPSSDPLQRPAAIACPLALLARDSIHD